MLDEMLGAVKGRNPKTRFIRLSDSSALSRVTDFVPTGCLPLDLIMGGGIPVGRIVEIYGDTSTGKTAVGEHILAETQKMGGTAVLFDCETALDLGMAEDIGIDVDELIYSVPETVEEVHRDFEDLLVAKNKVDPKGIMTVVWDSVAATSVQEEIDKVSKKGLGSNVSPAAHARLISQMCRVMRTRIAASRIAFVIINQTRAKIGVLFGPKKATFGGRAIGYYSSVRLELAAQGKIIESDVPVGINVRAYIAKNKIAVPFGKCTFPILFDSGIDECEAVFRWLKEHDAFEHDKGGSWYTLTFDDGTEIKFMHKDWPEVYEEAKDDIVEISRNI